MLLIVLSFMASPAVPYFSTSSQKLHDFRKEVIKYELCVLVSSTALSEKFLILSVIQRDVVINAHTSSCKVPATHVGLY